MKNDSINIEEFLNSDAPVPTEPPVEEKPPEEVDVQKAVVESLAAEKVEQDEKLIDLQKKCEAQSDEIQSLKESIANQGRTLADAQKESENLRKQISTLEAKIDDLKRQVACVTCALHTAEAKEIDQQERNPNALALLDRDVEIPDRFAGESRDIVLEALKAARIKAEEEGYVRRAQVLEGVLLANEPNGTLTERREHLCKLFADNGNIINGTVLAELDKLGISHKNGEEYLLPAEIIKRNY